MKLALAALVLLIAASSVMADCDEDVARFVYWGKQAQTACVAPELMQKAARGYLACIVDDRKWALIDNRPPVAEQQQTQGQAPPQK